MPLVTIGLVSTAGSLGFLSLDDPKLSPSQDSRHGPPEGSAKTDEFPGSISMKVDGG